MVLRVRLGPKVKPRHRNAKRLDPPFPPGRQHEAMARVLGRLKYFGLARAWNSWRVFVMGKKQEKLDDLRCFEFWLNRLSHHHTVNWC